MPAEGLASLVSSPMTQGTPRRGSSGNAAALPCAESNRRRSAAGGTVEPQKGRRSMSGRDDKAKGKLTEIKGNAKEGWGDVIGDDSLKAEGRGDQARGKGKQAVGAVKDAADDVKDAVKDTFRRKPD
jgi:uncharacterized protein YjbJ (UPF0337 family)